MEKTTNKVWLNYHPEKETVNIMLQIYLYPTFDWHIALVAYDRQLCKYVCGRCKDWSNKDRFALYAAEHETFNIFSGREFQDFCNAINIMGLPCSTQLAVQLNTEMGAAQYAVHARQLDLPPLESFKPLKVALKEAGL